MIDVVGGALIVTVGVALGAVYVKLVDRSFREPHTIDSDLRAMACMAGAFAVLSAAAVLVVFGVATMVGAE